jgi:hypothetical protein
MEDMSNQSEQVDTEFTSMRVSFGTLKLFRTRKIHSRQSDEEALRALLNHDLELAQGLERLERMMGVVPKQVREEISSLRQKIPLPEVKTK